MIIGFHRRPGWRWRDGSIGNVATLQAGGPEFELRTQLIKAGLVAHFYNPSSGS